MVSELIIGARGWQHPQWMARFYPDDMPVDWQFSFYSNEFQAVLLPQSELLAADVDVVQDWKDDVAQEFAFFIELDRLDHWQRCLTQLAPVRELVEGFVLRPAGCTIDDLASCVPALQDWAPVCLDESVTRSNEQLMRYARDHEIGCCWNALHDTPAWREGDLSVAMLESGFDFEPRQLREVLENCLRNTRGNAVRALFITGQGETRDTADGTVERQARTPSIDTLRQAMQLRDLIG